MLTIVNDFGRDHPVMIIRKDWLNKDVENDLRDFFHSVEKIMQKYAKINNIGKTRGGGKCLLKE